MNEYLMAGNQFAFQFYGLPEIEVLYDNVTQRLAEYMKEYNISEEAIVHIELIFRQKDKKLLSEFSLEKPSHVTRSDIVNTERELVIPVSINESSLGKALPVTTSNGQITHINVVLNDNPVNFLSVIRDNAKIIKQGHKDKITIFDDGFKFYLLRDKVDFILAIKVLGANSVKKIRYTLNGVILSSVTDVAVEDVILRHSDNKQLVVREGKVVFITQNIKLLPLKRPILKSLTHSMQIIDDFCFINIMSINGTYRVIIKTRQFY